MKKYTPTLHKKTCQEGYKNNNNNKIDQTGVYSWKQQTVNSNDTGQFCHVFYPSRRPMIPHLQRCQRFAVNDYSFTFGALNLQHPGLLERWGTFKLTHPDKPKLILP
jgi:hypothetical protein